MPTAVFVNRFFHDIPPDGIWYFILSLGQLKGAVTVTAHPAGSILAPPQFMEVIQMATRTVSLSHPGEPEHLLDIVVRNNGHVGGPGGTISIFDVFTVVVS